MNKEGRELLVEYLSKALKPRTKAERMKFFLPKEAVIACADQIGMVLCQRYLWGGELILI
jgi:hypothetical protein